MENGRVEMDEARSTRQLNLYRNVALAMTLLRSADKVTNSDVPAEG